MNKVRVTQALREYFKTKGRALSYEEYRDADDTPLRVNLVKRTLGGWNRVLATVGPIEKLEEPIKEPVEIKKDDKKPTK